MYDGKCRNMNKHLIEEHFSERPHVLRLAINKEDSTSYYDTVFGSFTAPNSSLNDIVLLREDGSPTYHFASVVDDHLMRISNVMRGQEWLSFLPYHVLLYDAFGWRVPVFSHLPLISSADGRKLSKRSLNQSNLVRDFKVSFIFLLFDDSFFRQEDFYPKPS